MKRFFFHLCARRDVEDRCGMLFEDDLQAFRAAQKLARAILKVRPALSGKAWISLTNDLSGDVYWACRGRRGAYRPVHRERSAPRRS